MIFALCNVKRTIVFHIYFFFSKENEDFNLCSIPNWSTGEDVTNKQMESEDLSTSYYQASTAQSSELFFAHEDVVADPQLSDYTFPDSSSSSHMNLGHHPPKEHLMSNEIMVSGDI